MIVPWTGELLDEIQRTGQIWKITGLDNWVLWDVREGNINLIFRVLACVQLDGQWSGILRQGREEEEEISGVVGCGERVEA